MKCRPVRASVSAILLLAFLGAACAAATLLNPYHFRVYRVVRESGEELTVTNPSEFPEGKIAQIFEPVVRATVLAPAEYPPPARRQFGVEEHPVAEAGPEGRREPLLLEVLRQHLEAADRDPEHGELVPTNPAVLAGAFEHAQDDGASLYYGHLSQERPLVPQNRPFQARC